MALILKKKVSGFRNWYEMNKQQLSEKRKKLYAENPGYRQRALEASRRYRRGERTASQQPEGLISFAQAAEHTGIGVSTLHEWRRKKYFPEPKHHNRGLWFSEEQVLLLTNLREFFRKYGKRRRSMNRERLTMVVASISANWD